MSDTSYPMHVGIVVQSAAQLSAVYALLGGASLNVLQTHGSDTIEPRIQSRPTPSADAKPDTGQSSAGSGTAAQGDQASAGTGATATSGASLSDGEVDAGGHPWSAELHASTKGKTKDGFWRMKVGVTRPAPMPGFPKGEPSTGATGTGSTDTAPPAGAAATSQGAGPAPGEDEDEFAAFRAAADKAGAADAAAAANVPARKWTDADLGALCNQAAVKLGDPAPVKAVIASFVPEGQVPHSRNIPDGKREEFAQAVEKAAGITFAG